ncbi:MAG: hypothetical protein AABZ30_11695, partial [Myxococcota bacterium]
RRFAHQRRIIGDLPKLHRRPFGLFAAKLLVAMEEARASTPAPDAVVFVVDARPAVFAVLRTELTAARANAGYLPLAFGLAVHEIEAWLLADPEARRAGMDADCAALAYGRPEDDPDPKTTFASWLGDARARASGNAAGLTDLERRALLIAAMRPDVVAQLCPLGFAPFLGEIRRLSSS